MGDLPNDLARDRRDREGTPPEDMEVLAVRIGFDMLAVQSPHHGSRGIGRYSANLVSKLLERDDGNQYVLYVHDDLCAERVPTSSRAEVRVVRPRWELGETMSPFMDRLARTNPDSLDAFVVLSPFERWAHYAPPSRPNNGLKMVSVVYDLIPFLFQNEREADPVMRRNYRTLETITRYDSLLAISEATRNDCLSVLKLPPDQVVSISGASNSSYFTPDRTDPMSDDQRLVLEGLGIDRPFVLNVGGLDDRKNTWKLLEAFAALPRKVRESHQLVLTFHLNEWGRNVIHHHVMHNGLSDSVVLTGEVTDETLLLLYQRCNAFLFPSLYEGFGLPILEAMHCGAAVVAGNNSSQPEVVGDAGLLADAADTTDIAAKLASILEDPDFARSLGDRAVTRAATFSWDGVAGRALDAVAALESRPDRARQFRFDRGHARKPRIAFFSPLPPRKSGVSDYAALLLDELRKTYRIDLFHDTGYIPEPALASDDYMSCDFRLFDRVAAARDYHALVYQMGNSLYHNFMYPIMLRHPGVVTLHDFCLAGFHINFGHHTGRGLGLIRDELLHWYPDCRDRIPAELERLGKDNDAISRLCAKNGWWLNRRVLEAAQVMVVHSPWCQAQVRAGAPEVADRVAYVPFGVRPLRTSADERAAIRDRFGLPQDALLVSSFGFVYPDKMNPQALDAFVTVAREDPKALFLFVGEEVDDGLARRHASALGISDRVRFMGRQPADVFDAMMAVTDVGINLRLPPTNGETSAALLNLLAYGVATVVTDVATFSDYPEGVVRKVKWDTENPEGLLQAVRSLTSDRHARETLGRAAWAYVNEKHEWSRVAQLYVDAIERCHDEQTSGRAVKDRPRALKLSSSTS